VTAWQVPLMSSSTAHECVAPTDAVVTLKTTLLVLLATL
jgi:hypothetical protein